MVQKVTAAMCNPKLHVAFMEYVALDVTRGGTHPTSSSTRSTEKHRVFFFRKAMGQ